MKTLKTIMLILLIGSSAFAQDVPAPAPVVEPVETQKFAVYVSGAEAGINKSLANKLIAAVVQGDKYSEIGDIEAFNAEFVKIPNANINQITQIAKKHKAEVLFLVNLTEAFGQYSVSARLIENGVIVKTVSLDHALKSLDDLSNLSGEITAQLIPSVVAPVAEPASAVSTGSTTETGTVAELVEAAEVEKCDTKYNKNELLYNVREGFLLGFKNCANELVKETALAKSPLAKKPAPVPASFITQCVMGSIKEKVDGVPGGEKITNVVENFLQTVLKAALSGGDPKALVSAAANLDITGMMETISGLCSNSSCFVDEHYDPPMMSGGGDDGYDGYENFSRERRFATVILNGSLFGLGSGILMDNWKSTFIELVLRGSGFALIFWGTSSTFTYSGYDYSGGYSFSGRPTNAGYLITYIGMGTIVSSVIYGIYQAVTYDKPKETAYNKHGSLNMAILPNSKGDGVAYGLVYRMGF